MKKKIALFGDSFGYQKKDNVFPSWVDLLEENYEITNYCQCGVSQYKILKQIENANLDQFDILIVLHTSFSRVFVEHNPLHSDNPVYDTCDIIYSDIENHDGEFAQTCRLYFKHIFSESYAKDLHNLICERIDKLCMTSKKLVIHATGFDYTDLYKFDRLENLHPIFVEHRGNVNHYNQKGNWLVYEKLSKRLNYSLKCLDVL
jgi:hypothetical protein